MQVSGSWPRTDLAGGGDRKLVLVVIDGLTPDALERGLAAGRLPTLAALSEDGWSGRGTSVFPSLTPVCLTSIATGAYPDVHHIPHLVWYHRGERRVIEYGSSFPAMRAVGARRAIRDTIFGMSGEHLAPGATTVFEALEDAGLEPAAINFTCYRGRTRHPIKLPAPARRNRWYEAVNGPRHFFYFNLFESARTGAPLAIRSRTEGSIDEYAAAVGRWLVTRDAFDFLVFYLPDYDYASHLAGPEGSLDALERTDRALGRLLAAAGGPEPFLERYAVVVTSDHGQTPVERVARLQDALPPSLPGVLPLASNRAGMAYRLPGCRAPTRELAERLDEVPFADVVLFAEDGTAVARRDGAELRFALEDEGWRLEGDPAVLDPELYPNGVERAWHAVGAPTAGEILVSAAEGWELVDGGGRHHAGGGSHGSLVAGDSLVPLIAAGFDEPPFPPDPAITDLAPLALAHFGVPAPESMRRAREAARA
ncbi:MAG TPA: alkaline phosphatase family protein [Gaiellaceae bacterium]|nr:alkaline phosphatase family protein [Gaiellaceae bacterium]